MKYTVMPKINKKKIGLAKFWRAFWMLAVLAAIVIVPGQTRAVAVT